MVPSWRVLIVFARVFSVSFFTESTIHACKPEGKLKQKQRNEANTYCLFYKFQLSGFLSQLPKHSSIHIMAQVARGDVYDYAVAFA